MDESRKNPHAVALGKKGGEKLAEEKGPEYFADLQAMRRERKGGRPKGPPKALYEGELRLANGNLVIPCAIVEDEDGTPRRVLSERGFVGALNLYRSGRVHNQSRDEEEEGGAVLPYYLAFPKLKPFIDKELELALLSPVWYKVRDSGALAKGTDARLIPRICDVWLQARGAKVLSGKRQLLVAQRAEILIRGLADVGIVALVDEATGYQDVRAREALAAILDQFVAKELSKWAKRFPDEFYKELFRLRGWSYYPFTVKRPPLVGKLTTNIVYDRLAPGVRKKLEQLNPKNPRGRRDTKHHQWLTPSIGQPELESHLSRVTTLMKAAEDWGEFKRLVNRALPRYPDMPLFDDLDKEEEEQESAA